MEKDFMANAIIEVIAKLFTGVSFNQIRESKLGNNHPSVLKGGRGYCLTY
jgi:hypothetical protein